MREIKFRAMTKVDDVIKFYPNTRPKMVFGTGIFKDPVNVWLCSHDDSKPLAHSMEKRVVQKNTISEYTDSKDKNGKEIYEGDICRFSYINPMNKKEVSILWKVEYSPGVFWLHNIDGGKQDTMLWMKHESIEVIGNIHENPELLGVRE